jgi:F420-non-reducing hydrogenase large subunit
MTTAKEQRQITISPTTRIEGHGKVTILLDESGNVSDAHFHVTEIRGFEQFLRGMETDRLPFIISRICGVCSTAHVVASCKAIENGYNVEITETAKKLRELLLMGQVITNNSLVFFFLVLPDFYFKLEEDPSKRNIFEIMRENPELGRKALELKMFGTQILQAAGKREVHVVSVVPGGIIRPLKESERTYLVDKGKKALELAQTAVLLGKELFERRWDEFRSIATIRSHYMGLAQNDMLNFHEGNLRIIGPIGEKVAEFPPENCLDYIEEKRLGWTYAKFAYLKSPGWPQGILKVGPTSRMNVIGDILTPLAKMEFREFRIRFGRLTHETLLFDYARLIELLYACERAIELLEDRKITKTNLRVEVVPKEGIGIGVVEAPRGTLVHRYALDKAGKTKNIKLIIPTQINNTAINQSVKDAAKEFIKSGEVKPGLLNSVEMVIRAYDPCIKCAARNLTNKGFLTVEVRNKEGEIVKRLC